MQHKGTRTRETARLVLRRFEPSDAPAMFANWASNPEVTRFLTWQPHADVAESARVVEQWCASYDDPTFYQWAIVLRETGEPIGSISVVRIDEAAESLEVGYCIGQAWWNQGYTSEALAAVIDYLLGEVGAGRIAACHDTDNPRSGGVMRHCGMSHAGTLRRAQRNNRGIVDVEVYDIMPEDWVERHRVEALLAQQHVVHPSGSKTPAASYTETTHLLRHEDINGENRLFGGRLMEWIDDAAGIAAKRHAGIEITTASVDTLEFRHPAFLDDVVAIDARVTFVGKSSMEVRVDSYVEDEATGERTLVNKAYLTEVCIDENGRPTVVPYGLALATKQELKEWEAALFRKEVRKARADSGI